MELLYAQTGTVLSNYGSRKDQIRFEIACLRGGRHTPVAGKAEGACVLSDSTPMLSGRSRTWVNDSATSTMTAHAS